MTLEPGARIGPYTIIAPLGVGGMGEVYRGRDPRLNRDVAIKVLPDAFAADPDRVSRFTREAQSLAALNHPHIAQLYGIEESGPTRAIVMELVEGETLADRLARGAIPLEEALPIARQVAEALEAAHDAGIIHRDLKPANVKVRAEGTVKVLDFGLAKAIEAAPAGSSAERADGAHSPAVLMNSPTMTSPAQTMRGVLLGTAAYMAPEQARGKPVDQRADIWALGCVLYEMLTGRPAFTGDDVTDLVTAVLRDEPDWSALPAMTSEPLRRLLRRTLTKDQRRRMHSAADVRLEIDDALAAPPEAAAPAPARRSRWHLAVAGAVGATIVAVSLPLLGAWRSARAPAPMNGRLSLSFWLSPSATGGVVNELAISPDGAYLVTGGVGTSGIWIHPLNGGPPRHLDALANGVCWSPDSRTLLYPRPDGRLVKHEVATGAAVLFAEPPAGARGHCTWSSNGVILFAAGGGFYQIPASGGTWTPVAVEDGAGEQATRSVPAFLPDGRHFLYAIPGQLGRASIRVASLDAAKATTLLDDAESDIAYADGHLLFQRGADLVAQPFNLESLSLSGEPRPIATGTHSGVVGPGPSFTVSRTGVLVHAVPKLGRLGRLEWFDRTGRSLGVVAQPDGTEYLNPSLSPDQRTLAVNRMDPATGNWDIWLIDLPSARATRLTTHAGTDSDPIWSPDGRQIVYRSERAQHIGIYRLSIADGREEELLRCEERCGRTLIPCDWTPDGRFILYQAAPSVTRTVSAEGDPKADSVSIPGVRAAVSPDGKWVAYVSAESGSQQVYVQPFPGLRPRTVASTVAGGFPRWRADGKELFFSGRAQGLPLFTVLSVDVSINAGGVRTSAPRVAVPSVELMSLVDSRPHFAIAGEGQRILMRQPDGPSQPALRVIVNWRSALR